MRRPLTLLVVAVGAVLLTGTNPSGSDRIRVDAVFDTAKGLVPGQSMKVAGSRVGQIDSVRLVKRPDGGYQARLRLTVDREFAPFRADASCRILPQGLLSENYVECDPGSPSRPNLPLGADGVPVVEVEHTSVPATLQDLLTTFSVPTAERLGILFSQLGLGTAGRGADLNAVLRRANPALVQADRVLQIVSGQRRRLRASLEQTDRILAGLGHNDAAVRRFVSGAATLVETTASRRADLADAIRRLPGALDAVEATLPSLQRLTAKGTPLLRSLRTAAPALAGFTERFPQFGRSAMPALRSLGDAAVVGRRAVEAAERPVAHLRELADAAVPTLRSANALAVSARDAGGLEDILRMSYGMSTDMGAYDAQGHLLLIGVEVYPRCIVAIIKPGTEVEPGCSHAYSSPGFGRIPTTQAPPAGTTGTRVTSKTVEDLLDYLLK